MKCSKGSNGEEEGTKDGNENIFFFFKEICLLSSNSVHDNRKKRKVNMLFLMKTILLCHLQNGKKKKKKNTHTHTHKKFKLRRKFNVKMSAFLQGKFHAAIDIVLSYNNRSLRHPKTFANNKYIACYKTFPN